MAVFKRWNGTSWETIGPQISSARFDDTNHMIAPEYSSTSTYNVGDYVVQSDRLYKCISAIESAEKWTAAHWTQVSMGGEVNSLNSVIVNNSDRLQSVDGQIVPKWVDGDVNGNAYYNGMRIRTPYYIYLKAGTTITVDSGYKAMFLKENGSGSAWFNSFVLTTNGNYALCVRKDPEAFYQTQSELSSKILIYDKEQNSIASIQAQLEEQEDMIAHIIDNEFPIPNNALFNSTPPETIREYNYDAEPVWFGGNTPIGQQGASDTYIDISIAVGQTLCIIINDVTYDTNKMSFVSGFVSLYNGTQEVSSRIPLNSESLNEMNISITAINVATRIRIYFLFSSLVDRTGQLGEEVPISFSFLFITNGVYIINKSILQYPLDEQNAATRDDGIDADCYIYRKFLPSYYTNQDNLNNNSYLDNKVYSSPNGKKFIFVTDDHWPSNARKNIELIQYVRKLANARYVINGGDYLNIAATKQIAINQLTDSAGRYRAAFGKYYLPVRGNHDDNCNSGSTPMTDEEKEIRLVPPTDVYNVVFGGLVGSVYTEDVKDKLTSVGISASHVQELAALSDMTYYVDDDFNKIRFIVTNTGATGYKYPLDDFGLWTYQESWLNLEFIATAIKEIPNNYDIVVLGHMFNDANTSPDENGRLPTYSFVTAIGKMLTALKQKQVITISLPYATGNQTFLDYMGASSFTFDFSRSNNVGKMMVISGHFHNDGVCVYDGNTRVKVWDGTDLTQNLTTVEIPFIQITTDAYLQNQFGGPEMTIDTITEQAFDLITITDNGINLTRIGAGEDRFVPIIV